MAREDLKVVVGASTVGLNKALSSATKEIQSFKRRVVKAGLGLAGILGPSTWMGANFEKNIKFATQVATRDINKFEGNLKAFTKVAREMGKTTEYTATQSAEALKFLGMAGLEADKAVAALPATINLATAGMISLGEAADIATNIMTQMQLEVKDLTRVNDVLAKVQSTANTNIQQAAEAFIYGGTMARQMGMSIEEVAAIIGLLANRGIRASLAGTALRQSMIKMLNPSKKAQEIMDRYKISLEGVGIGGKSFIEVIKKIADSGLESAEIAKLLGARALQLSAIFNEGSKGINKYVKALEDSKGTSDRLAESIRDTLWGSFKALFSAIQEVGLALFDKYKKPLRDAIDATVDYVRSLGTWIDANGKLIAQGMGSFINGIKNSMIKVVEFIKSHKEVLEFGAIGWFFMGKKGFLLASAIGVVYDEILSKFAKTADESAMKRVLNAYKEVNRINDELKKEKRPPVGTSQEDWLILNKSKISEKEKEKARYMGIIEMYTNTQLRLRRENREREEQESLNRQIDAWKRSFEEKDRILAKAYLKELERKKKQTKKLTEEERDRLEEVAKNNREAEAELNQKIYEDRIKWLSEARKVEDQIKEDELKKEKASLDRKAELWRKYYQNLAKEQEKSNETLKYVSNALSNSFSNAFGSIIAGTKSVSGAFRDMAEAILQSISRLMTNRLSEQIVGVLFEYAKNINWGSMFSSTYTPSSTRFESGMSMASQTGGYYHNGGIVGYGSVPKKSFNPLIFANAPKLHNGLSADEYPAILQRGETVIPKGGSPNVIINIINETGKEVKGEQQGDPQFDGKNWVISMVLEGLQTNMGFRNAIGAV